MFEKASRLKLRFFYKGPRSVEDLWDIPLKELDSLYKGLNALSKTMNEESLLEARSQENSRLDLEIMIVKHVVGVRLREQKDREEEAARSGRKQKIMGVIAKKQDAALENLSLEELTKLAEGD